MLGLVNVILIQPKTTYPESEAHRRDGKLELFDSSEMSLAGRTSCLNDFVFLAHECRETTSVNFVLDCAA
jgi:hypothetical protein